jgi:hypothetical protein
MPILRIWLRSGKSLNALSRLSLPNAVFATAGRDTINVFGLHGRGRPVAAMPADFLEYGCSESARASNALLPVDLLCRTAGRGDTIITGHLHAEARQATRRFFEYGCSANVLPFVAVRLPALRPPEETLINVFLAPPMAEARIVSTPTFFPNMAGASEGKSSNASCRRRRSTVSFCDRRKSRETIVTAPGSMLPPRPMIGQRRFFIKVASESSGARGRMLLPPRRCSDCFFCYRWQGKFHPGFGSVHAIKILLKRTFLRLDNESGAPDRKF